MLGWLRFSWILIKLTRFTMVEERESGRGYKECVCQRGGRARGHYSCSTQAVPGSAVEEDTPAVTIANGTYLRWTWRRRSQSLAMASRRRRVEEWGIEEAMVDGANCEWGTRWFKLFGEFWRLLTDVGLLTIFVWSWKSQLTRISL